MKIVPASIEIISTEPYEEMLKRVERAGRVCYKSEESIADGSAERFIRNILKRGHESVIEHAGITFSMNFIFPVPDASLLAVEICSDTSAAAKISSALDTR